MQHPMIVLDVIVRYSGTPTTDPTLEPVAGVSKDDGGGGHKLSLYMPCVSSPTKGQPPQVQRMQIDVPVRVAWKPSEQDLRKEGASVWGLVKLGPTVWKVWGAPVQIAKMQAIYITLVDVPDPPPFEPSPIALVH